MFGINFCMRKFRKLRKNEDGATALEFAILAVPFFTILFGIIELAAILFVSSSLNHGMREASRYILTGQLQNSCNSLSEKDFKEYICEGMGSGGSTCESNLRFDVVSSTDGKFSTNLLPEVTFGDEDEDGEIDDFESAYTSTGANDVVIVRAQYKYPLAFPGQWTRLANAPGNTRILTATTAFRNEPFPGGC